MGWGGGKKRRRAERAGRAAAWTPLGKRGAERRTAVPPFQAPAGSWRACRRRRAPCTARVDCALRDLHPCEKLTARE